MIKIKPLFIEVEFDKVRNFGFTNKGFAYLDERYNGMQNIYKALLDSEFQKTIKGGALGIMTEFIYAGLMHEDKELTPEIVSNFIGIANMGELRDLIYKALNLSLPEKKEDSENPEKQTS